MHHFVEEVVHSSEHEIEALQELGLAMAAFAVAGIGAALAAFLYYYRTDLLPRVSELFKPLYGVVYNKFYVDELYNAVIVRPLLKLSDTVLYRVIDQRLIDGLGVNGVASLVTNVADRGLKFLQTGFTQSYVFGMVVGAAVIVAYMVGGR
jgi:NADH-quinone oxidoreductase subunit L